MTEDQLREEIVWWGRSLFDRGLTSGTSGNISVRCGAGFLATPTNSCLGRLDPARLSRSDAGRQRLDGDPPTKEIALHRLLYAAHPANGAVVHLHSTHATALSCRADIDADNLAGRDALCGDAAGHGAGAALCPVPGRMCSSRGCWPWQPRHAGVLLGNHGRSSRGHASTAAAGAIEELEEAARPSLPVARSAGAASDRGRDRRTSPAFRRPLMRLSANLGFLWPRTAPDRAGLPLPAAPASGRWNCTGPMMFRPISAPRPTGPGCAFWR